MEIDNKKHGELQLLTELEVADLLKWSPKTLRKARTQKRGPKFLKVGGSIRYRVSDLAKYLNTRPTGGTAA